MYDPVNKVLLWEPYTLKVEDNSTVVGGDGLVIKPQNPTDIPLSESLVNSNIVYVEILEADRYGRELIEFYKKMVEIEYNSVFMPEITAGEAYASYVEYKAEYNGFVKDINVEFVNLSVFSKAMLGL